MKKKTAKKSNKKSEMRFVLDGEVRIEEHLGKKIISSERIDSNVVLGLLMEALSYYLDSKEA